ncbi:MAG: hypothetical protein ACI9NQ_000416 [Paracoccaceae bacterium]|jgi:hypothetical protein
MNLRIPLPSIVALCASLSFAANASAESYVQNFDGFADGTTVLGDGSMMNGTASIQGGQLELTRDGVAGGGASFAIPALAESSLGWSATFDVSISDSVGDNEPADGFSLNYGNAALTEIGSAEEGMAGAGDVTENISFEVDTWMNLDAEQGVNIAEKVGGADTNLSFTNGPILTDGTTVSGEVVISFHPVNGLSFTTTGLLTNADFLNVPTTFDGDDAYTFVFSARVGGANQTVLIDNFTIETGSGDDSDGDGLSNVYETLNGLDPDDDGSGDPNNGADGDPDMDNLTNIEERDLGTNPQEADTDSDGYRDDVENNTTTWVSALATGTDPINDDSDGDGLLDGVENPDLPFVDADQTGSDPNIVDSDTDGLDDGYEITNSLNPSDDGSGDPENGADGDPDMDNLTNIEELDMGTDPQDGDTDMDDLSDGVETNTGIWVSPTDTGTDPLNSDSDGDGLLDGVENPDLPFVDANQPGTDPNNSDGDNDTISDGDEIEQGSNPTVAQAIPVGYFQDFDGFADGSTDVGDGSVMNGTANIQGGKLELTRDGVAGGAASFMIPADAVPGSGDGWTATFDLTISDSPGSNEPADGMSFNYGNFSLTELGSAEEGMAGAGDVTENISFEIDTWMNLDAEQGVNIAEKVGGNDLDLSFTGGSILSDGTSVSGPVVCIYDPVDGLSFTTEGLLTDAVFENVAASFLGDDAYNFGFSARVGGANQTLTIDNLRIFSSNSQQDRLRIISIDKVVNDVTLTWTSSDRKTYGVYTSTDLQGEWQELDDSVLGAAGMTTTSFTEVGVPNGTVRRFYEVREAP